eukprot:scaffold228760_cov37-Tisochrysis_lutea.AAC.1
MPACDTSRMKAERPHSPRAHQPVASKTPKVSARRRYVWYSHAPHCKAASTSHEDGHWSSRRKWLAARCLPWRACAPWSGTSRVLAAQMTQGPTHTRHPLPRRLLSGICHKRRA